MTSYIYGGPAKFIGRFGNVVTGQTVELTDAEAAYVSNDPNYRPKPAVLAATLEKSADYAFSAASADANKLLRTRQTAQITLTLPDDPSLGDSYQVIDGGATGAGTHNIIVAPGATKTISGLKSSVASVAVTTPGTGLTSRPTIAITGDGSGATATATMKIVSATIAAAGATYAANDVLTVVGGTSTVPATITVNTVDGSGHITGFTITQAGTYTALPANPVAVTGGAGTGATFTLAWGVRAITVTNAGTGYSQAFATPTTGGGTLAVLAVTLAPQNKVLSTNGARFNVYWDGEKWAQF